MSPTTSSPPAGFAPLHAPGRFVQRSGDYFVREETDGARTVGAWVGVDQSNTEGFAHGGFLLTFADFALTIITMGITLNLTADFLRPARIGDWIEARIMIRKRSTALVFADAIVTSGGRELLRVGGLFRPAGKAS